MVVKPGLNSALSIKHKRLTFSLLTELRRRQHRTNMEALLYSDCWYKIAWLLLSPGYGLHSQGPKGSCNHHIKDSSGKMKEKE